MYSGQTALPEPSKIASLIPSASSYGPSEAGKRAQEQIVVTVNAASGVPVAGARWRWGTDQHSGWYIRRPGQPLPTAASPRPGLPVRQAPAL